VVIFSFKNARQYLATEAEKCAFSCEIVTSPIPVSIGFPRRVFRSYRQPIRRPVRADRYLQLARSFFAHADGLPEPSP
jgi:hypothetical protein